MSKDISTVLVCPVCSCTLFKEKNNEGNILLHCTKCGGAAKVTNAGIGFAVVNKVQDSGKVFPIVIDKRTSSHTSDVVKFEILEFRLPYAVKKIVQAALWAAKCQMQIRGSWYGGAVLAHICADYLSGVDYNRLGATDLQRLTSLLQSAADRVEKEREAGEVFSGFPKGFQVSASTAVAKATNIASEEFLRLAMRKQNEYERLKTENRTKRIRNAIRARTEKSSKRLDRCILSLETQLQEAKASDSAEDALEREYLESELQKGIQLRDRVRSGELTLSSSIIQRFMSMTEKSLGIRRPREVVE